MQLLEEASLERSLFRIHDTGGYPFCILTDVPTTWGTWAPACPLMDPTQWLRPGPSGPWSSPEEGDWPVSRPGKGQEIFWLFHVLSHELPSFRPFETFKDPRHVHFLHSLGLRSEGSLSLQVFWEATVLHVRECLMRKTVLVGFVLYVLCWRCDGHSAEWKRKVWFCSTAEPCPEFCLVGKRLRLRRKKWFNCMATTLFRVQRKLVFACAI